MSIDFAGAVAHINEFRRDGAFMALIGAWAMVESSTNDYTRVNRRSADPEYVFDMPTGGYHIQVFSSKKKAMINYELHDSQCLIVTKPIKCERKKVWILALSN